MSILANFRKRILLPALAVAAAGLAAPALGQKKIKVVGFYPVYDLTPMLTDAQLDLLSHIIIFSLTPSADGSLTGTSIQKDLTNLSLVADIISRARNKGISVMISVGGAGKSQNFPALVNNPTARKNYIAGLVDLCISEGIAGVDIDWEFPMNEHASGLTSFMKELKAALTPNGLLLSTDVQASKEVSVSGNTIGSTWTAKYPKDALTACDFVNLMAYDDDYGEPVRQHAPEDMAKSQTNLYGTFLGSSQKVAMGVPFYGKQGFNNRRDFKVIAAQNNPPASADVAGGYYYNGPDMLARKTAYTITNNNAGIMIWDLIKDAADFRLLKAINGAVKSNNAVLDLKPKPINSIQVKSRALRGLDLVGADLVLPGDRSGLLQGAPRLSILTSDGRGAEEIVPRTGANGELVWNLASVPSGKYFYRVKGKTGDISGALNLRK